MKTFTTFLLICFFTQLFSQKLHSVNYSSQADLKVFVVDYENQADLKVYKVKYQNQASGNEGKWFFVDYPSQADKKIYFVDYASQADLKIYFVKYQNQAGWRNSEKKHLLYWGINFAKVSNFGEVNP